MLTMELKQLTSTWQQNGQEQKSDFRCFGGLVYGEFVLLYDIYGTPKRFHFGSSQARF